MKRFASIFVLLFILCSALVSLSEIRIVKASGTIYIRADGSVEGTDKIQRNGNVYTFLGNISIDGSKVDGIIVEKDNIVIDGASYTLQKTGNLSYMHRGINGINLTARKGVTVKNLRIMDFVFNIQLINSSNNTIFGNYICTSEIGINLLESHNNSIIQNELVSNGESMLSILNLGKGYSNSIQLANSSNNTIVGNYIYTPEWGIGLIESHSNSIIKNNLASNGEGIGITFDRYSFNDTISGNSFNNTISGNNIIEQGIGIKSLTGSKSIISGNNITNCKIYGIFLESYQQINIIGNNFENNAIGIFLGEKASNNTIYHNNFINNQKDVADVRSVTPWLHSPKNIWDNGSRGNYWSDYNGTDNDGNGIGDTPYVINENNQDNFPLMNPWDPPRIHVVSPDFGKYAVTDVPLTFTVDKPTSWIGYSLDGQANITISGNTTLTGLSDGSHNLTVYAKDSAGNTGTSETIIFSLTEPFLTVWIVAAIVIIAVVGTAILVYFKKIKKTTVIS